MVCDVQVTELGTREQAASGNASLATTSLSSMLDHQGSARERTQVFVERSSLAKWGETSQEAGRQNSGLRVKEAGRGQKQNRKLRIKYTGTLSKLGCRFGYMGQRPRLTVV